MSSGQHAGSKSAFKDASPELIEKIDPAGYPSFGGKYDVIEVIGQGGMGTVYRVKDPTVLESFAVKVLKPELATDQSALKRFEQESRALSDLNHPNIVAVFAGGKTDSGAPYLVMDYIKGQSLAQEIKELGGMDVNRALLIFIEICDALHHAHDKGIIHRDLKPSNIILGKNDAGIESARVVDFGIAKVMTKPGSETVTGLTQMGDLFGTPTYMSPEQCQGEKLDARSDIYALGCVMFETLNGTPPFTETNPFKLMTKHVSEKAPPLNRPGVSRVLADVIAKCLEKRPEKRYQSIDQLVEDLAAIRNSKKPKHLGRKELTMPKMKWSKATIGKLALTAAAMMFGGAIAFQALFPPINTFSVATTGVPIVPPEIMPAVTSPSAVSPITVPFKPNIPRPKLTRPAPFAELKYVPFKEAPLSDSEKTELRTLLYSVTPTNKDTIEPVLRLGKRVIPDLFEFVKGGDPGLSRAAAIALSRFGSIALPGLAQTFKEDSNGSIGQALQLMGDSGVMAIAPMLTNSAPDIRARAAKTVRESVRFRAMPNQLTDTLAWLALEDPDPQTRAEATRALAQATGTPTVHQALEWLALNDSASIVRTAGVQSLIALADRQGDASKETLDVIGWVIQQDSNVETRVAPLSSVYLRNYGRALAPYLRSAYRLGSLDVKRIIIGLARQDQVGDALLPELIDALNDTQLRSTAMAQLSLMGSRAKAALPALQRLLVVPLSDSRYGNSFQDWQHKEVERAIERISK